MSAEILQNPHVAREISDERFNRNFVILQKWYSEFNNIEFPGQLTVYKRTNVIDSRVVYEPWNLFNLANITDQAVLEMLIKEILCTSVFAALKSFIFIHSFISFEFTEKESPGGNLYKRCSKNFHKIHTKTPVLKGLF